MRDTRQYYRKQIFFFPQVLEYFIIKKFTSSLFLLDSCRALNRKIFHKPFFKKAFVCGLLRTMSSVCE